MVNRKVNLDALLLEDFDIVNMKEWCPDRQIGVSVNRIYIQIAKFSDSPKRREELTILSEAISNFGYQEMLLEPRYVPMKVCDVAKCFDKCLKRLPKSTFVNL